MHEKSDEALLELWARDRDAMAFKELTDRYARMVYGTCRRILRELALAEDAAQECFEALAQAGIGPGRCVGPWLHKVAVRCALKRQRSEGRRARRERRYADEQDARHTPVWDDVSPLVDEAITALPDKFRVPLTRHFLEGLSQEFIAAELGVTRQAVGYRIQRGIELTREHLRRRGVAIPVAALAAMLHTIPSEATPVTLVAALGRMAVRGPLTAPAVLAKGSSAWMPLAVKAAAIVTALAIAALPFVFRGSSEGPGGDAQQTASDKTPRAGDAPPAQQPAVPTNAAPVPLKDPIDVSPPPKPTLGTIRARVVDENADPVAGARVVLQELKVVEPLVFHPASVTKTLVTSADGFAVFTGLPLRTQEDLFYHDTFSGLSGWVLLATTPRAAATAVGTAFAEYPESSVLLELYPAQSVSGRIVGPEGEPVPGAAVYVANPKRVHEVDDAQLLVSAASDDQGVFVLENVPPDRQELYVRAAGYAPRVTEPITPPLNDIEVRLSRGGTLEGVLTDAATGQALAGVGISLMGRHEVTQYWRNIESDDNGAFRVEHLPAECSPFALSFRGGWKPPRSRVEVEDGKTTTLALPLERWRMAEGRVYDVATGAGFPAVRIEAQGFRTWTGSNGEFRIELGNAETEVEIDHVDGYRVVTASEMPLPYRNERAKLQYCRPVTLKPGELTIALDFPLVRGSTASGIVLSTDGHPLGGAELAFDEYYLKQKTTTRPDGTFTLQGLLAEEGTLTVTAEGFEKREHGPFDFGSESAKAIRIVLEPEALISGVVADCRGKAIPLTPMEAVPAGEKEGVEKWTDAAGRFTFDKLTNGDYVLKCAASSERHEVVDLTKLHVDAGQRIEDLSLVMPPSTRVEGIVRIGGIPVSGAKVVCGEFQDTISTKTDSNGHYLLDAVRLEDAEFHCSAKTQNVMWYKVAKLQPHKSETTSLDFNFVGGNAALEGTVTIDGRSAKAFIIISLKGADGETDHLKLDDDGHGRFAAQSLPEGTLEFELQADSQEVRRISRKFPVTLVNGKTTRLDIDVSGPPLFCQVKNWEEYPTLDACVHEGRRDFPKSLDDSPYSPPPFASTRVYEGAFSIPALPPGTYTVVVFGRKSQQEYPVKYSAASKVVLVKDQPEIHLELEMP